MRWAKPASFIVGLAYASAALLVLYNWGSSTFGGSAGVEELAWLVIPSDLGLAVGLLAASLSFLFSFSSKEGSLEESSSLLVGCVVGVALMSMQVLAALAGAADAALAGEEGYALLEALLRPDVVLGVASLALTPKAWSEARSLTYSSRIRA